ncbi:MAG: hypothetical protein ACUVYA_18145, partial [Planctomycetota bacterium]
MKRPGFYGLLCTLGVVGLLGRVFGTHEEGVVCTACGDTLPGISICNDGQRGQEAFSSNPVRYLDGVAAVSVPGLAFPACEGGWGFALTYLNRVTPEDWGAVVREDAGYNWVTNVPRLEIRREGELWLNAGSTQQVRFRPWGQNQWRSERGIYVPLSYDGNYYYTLEGARGGTATFYGYGGYRGKLAWTTGPDLAQWTFSYYGAGDGMYAYKLRQIVSPGGKWRMCFGYRSDGKLDKVELKHLESESPRATVATMHFAYYAVDYSGKGCAGDLRCVSVVEESRSPRTTYFRYYTASSADGRQHDLKYVIGPESYAELDDLHGFGELEDCPGIPPEGAFEGLEDSAFDGPSGYRFDQKLLYYPSWAGQAKSGRVKKEVVRTGSCGCPGTASVGTWEYDYQVLARPSDYQTVYVKVKVKRPDGHWKYLELNRLGAALLSVDAQVAGGQAMAFWARRYEYDSESLLTRIAHPSACDASGFAWTSWSSWPDGTGVSVRSDAGLLEVFEYLKEDYSSPPPPRKHFGSLVRHSLQVGTAGPTRTLRELTYSGAAADGKWIYPKSETVYPLEGGGAVTTSYGYEIVGPWDFLKSRTVYHPVVTKPGGSLAATTKEEYYESGLARGRLMRLTEGADGEGEGGVVTQFSYEWSSEPDWDPPYREWRVVDPDGLALREETWYDRLGRSVVRVRGTGSGPYPDTELRRERWLYATLSKGVSGEQGDEGKGDGYLPRDADLAYEHIQESEGTVSSRDGVARITVRNLRGQLVEEAVGRSKRTGAALSADFTSTATTLEGAFRDLSQSARLFERTKFLYDGPALVERRRFLEAENPGAGSHVASYKYDDMGRLIEEKNAAGTIRRYTRDALGRTTAVAVGIEGGELMTVETREYDRGSAGGDSLLTRVSRPVGDGTVRETRYAYDAWHRERIQADWVGMLGTSYWAVEERSWDDAARVVRTATYLGTSVDFENWERFYHADLAGHLWEEETESHHDERGREWKRVERWKPIEEGGQPGTPGTDYVTLTWQGRRGEVLKVQPPGMLFEKHG